MLVFDLQRIRVYSPTTNCVCCHSCHCIVSLYSFFFSDLVVVHALFRSLEFTFEVFVVSGFWCGCREQICGTYIVSGLNCILLCFICISSYPFGLMRFSFEEDM